MTTKRGEKAFLTSVAALGARARDDPVESPLHYGSGPIECIDAIYSMLGADGFVAYCRGNVIKYAWRAPLKGRQPEDLAKAAKYERFAQNVLAGRRPTQDAEGATS